MMTSTFNKTIKQKKNIYSKEEHKNTLPTGRQDMQFFKVKSLQKKRLLLLDFLRGIQGNHLQLVYLLNSGGASCSSC